MYIALDGKYILEGKLIHITFFNIIVGICSILGLVYAVIRDIIKTIKKK